MNQQQELLAALKAITEYVEKQYTAGVLVFAGPYIEAARAAIAKAEGHD